MVAVAIVGKIDYKQNYILLASSVGILYTFRKIWFISRDKVKKLVKLDLRFGAVWLYFQGSRCVMWSRK